MAKQSKTFDKLSEGIHRVGQSVFPLRMYLYDPSLEFLEFLLQQNSCADWNIYINSPNQNLLNAALYKYGKRTSLKTELISQSSQANIEFAINKAYHTYGGFDYAINNYRLPDSPTNLIDCSPELCSNEYRAIFVNVFLLIKYMVSLMLGNSKGGKIINLFHHSCSDFTKNEHALYSLLCAVRGLCESVSFSYTLNRITITSYLLTTSVQGSAGDYHYQNGDIFDLCSPKGIIRTNELGRELSNIQDSKNYSK
ncbi:MAG: hypothetical protein LWX56_04955 [Ignavibacteria bacterium]|nr:hypothetical protein [Ignavibacteria bacterium]